MSDAAPKIDRAVCVGEQTSGIRHPGVGQQLSGLFSVSHPFPSGMFVIAVGLLSWMAASSAHRSEDPAKLVLLLAGVACTQIAVGAVNDVRDLELDRESRPTKPIVRGAITPRQALILASVTTLAVFVLVTPLGLGALVLCLLLEALGLAYDLGLKSTPLSALLFAVFFPVLPLLAWTVFGAQQTYLFWLVPVLALLGVTMNVSNSLPDLEDDVKYGIGGFPHLLGVRGGLVAVASLPLVSLAMMWALSLLDVVPARLPTLLIASVAGLVAATTAAALVFWTPEPRALRTTFMIQSFGVFGLGVGWLAAISL